MPLPLGKGRPQGRPTSPRLTQPVGLSPETSSHPPHRTEGAALPGQSRGSWVPVPPGSPHPAPHATLKPLPPAPPCQAPPLPLPSPRSPAVSLVPTLPVPLCIFHAVLVPAQGPGPLRPPGPGLGHRHHLGHKTQGPPKHSGIKALSVFTHHLYFFTVHILAMAFGTWDLCSLTRDRTHIPVWAETII